MDLRPLYKIKKEALQHQNQHKKAVLPKLGGIWVNGRF